MTDSPGLTATAARASDVRVIGAISLAHFVSHYYILILAPLFAFVRADYGVSYTELGAAIAAFNLVSGVLQTPAGLLVDKIGARPLLVAGTALCGLSFVAVGLIDSFPVLILLFAVAGIGNTVFHPADYAILSRQVSPQRTAQAYSVHTFSGMLGTAAAPTALIFLERMVGWRGAFIASGLVGIAVAAFVAMQRDIAAGRRAEQAQTPVQIGWRLLLSPAILLNFAFFTALSFINAGVQNFSVVALESLFGTPLAVASAALTAFLLGSAAGVLAGGTLTKVRNPALPVVAGMAAAGLALAAVAAVALPDLVLIAALGFAGFATGATMPSRDLIVRAITPAGAFGTVFGFLTTGINVAWVVAPLICGQFMDHGMPRGVFVILAAVCLIAIPTVLAGSRRPA